MGDKSDSSWFGSWLNAAKNKSTEVLEFVKKDLEEFGSVVKNEATSVVSSAGAVVEKTLSLDSPDSTVSSVKRSFSTFLGQVNTVLNPSPDDSDTEAMLIVENSELVAMNKFQKLLYELQNDPNTYLCDPETDLSKQYECWLEILDNQLSDDRIAKHVNSSEVLKKFYAKLVPEVVEHQEFWKRYLFKKALLEDEIARQEALEKREQEKEKELTGENLAWEQESFAEDIELTEEQQIKLLEQYDNEMKQKKNSNVKPSKSNDAEINKNSETESNKKEVKKSGDNKKINKVDSAVSLGSPSSNSSTDDDWEKVEK